MIFDLQARVRSKKRHLKNTAAILQKLCRGVKLKMTAVFDIVVYKETSQSSFKSQEGATEKKSLHIIVYRHWDIYGESPPNTKLFKTV